MEKLEELKSTYKNKQKNKGRYNSPKIREMSRSPKCRSPSPKIQYNIGGKLKWFGNPSDFENISRKYKFVEKIGQGGFSTVYSAERVSPSPKQVASQNQIYSPNTSIIQDYIITGLEGKEIVAIKCVAKRKAKKTKVENEIRILKSLNHPNIVKLLDIQEDQSSVYIILEFLGLKSLDYYFKNKISLSSPQIKSICKNVLSALSYLEDKAIFHRDLKLSNVMYDGETAKIIDFGMASYESTVKNYSMCGTELYYAPEMVGIKGYIGHKIDVWCLGIIFFCLSTKQYPFQTGKTKSLKEQILLSSPFHSIIKKPSKEDRWIIKKLLNKNGEERPTALEVIIIIFLMVRLLDGRIGMSNGV